MFWRWREDVEGMGPMSMTWALRICYILRGSIVVRYLCYMTRYDLRLHISSGF